MSPNPDGEEVEAPVARNEARYLPAQPPGQLLFHQLQMGTYDRQIKGRRVNGTGIRMWRLNSWPMRKLQAMSAIRGHFGRSQMGKTRTKVAVVDENSQAVIEGLVDLVMDDTLTWPLQSEMKTGPRSCTGSCRFSRTRHPLCHCNQRLFTSPSE